MTLVLIVALAIGTVALKVAGPLLAGGRTPPPVVTRVIELLAPALLTALIVVGTVTEDGALVLDARILGLGVGALALWFRAPVVVAFVLGAATAALVRFAF